MTLNATVFHPQYIAQVSDRRLSDIRGVPTTDAANKLVVVVCQDATLLVTYTGVGAFPRSGSRSLQRVDSWIAERLQDRRATDLAAEGVVAEVIECGNSLFARSAARVVPHVFAIAGWVGEPGLASARFWRVDNISPDGTPRPNFSAVACRASPGLVVATGAVAALERLIRRKLSGRLRAAKSSDDVARILVETVREAAASEKGRTIGPNCVVAMLSPSGQAGIAGYGLAGRQEAISPTALWAAGSNSFLVKDVQVSSAAYGLRLGEGPRRLELMSGRMAGKLVTTKLPAGSVSWQTRMGHIDRKSASESSIPVVGVFGLE